MGERHSKRKRDKNDWYVEPNWAVERLFDKVTFAGHIHDPCCGMGTIVQVAADYGYPATGSDKVDRGYGYEKMDFFKRDVDCKFHNIVTNPPYKIASMVIERALNITTGRVAALVQTKFLSSQGRFSLFNNPMMERVIIFSRRPSMPPGKELEKYGESIRGGGSIDFCWMIWNHNKPTKKAAIVEWTL